MRDWNRREFLRLLTALPPLAVFGCDSKGRNATLRATIVSPEESMKKLIRVLGPWSEREQADDFAKRFLATEPLVRNYMPGSNVVIQNLAARFSDQAIAMDQIHLKIPSEERKLLLDLAKQIYSFTEVRFLVCKEPPAGQCLGDNTWHTKNPLER